MAYHRDKAERLAGILWDEYNENGGKLYLSDIKKLTGYEPMDMYKKFKNHNIKGPPIYDTNEAKRDRRLKAMNDEATRLGRDWLTSHEVAALLGVRLSNVSAINQSYTKDKLKFPKIIFARQNNNEKGVGMPRQKVTDRYPEGLPVLRVKPGPAPNQTTYVIR